MSNLRLTLPRLNTLKPQPTAQTCDGQPFRTSSKSPERASRRDIRLCVHGVSRYSPITHSYRPPALLQVSRESRQKFATTYYGSSNVFVSSDADSMKRWLQKLNRHHRALVQTVIYVDGSINRVFKPPLDPEEMRRDISIDILESSPFLTDLLSCGAVSIRGRPRSRVGRLRGR